MSIDNKPSKTKNDNNPNEYLAILCDKISHNLQPSKKLEKNDNENSYIPKFNESNLLLKYNYNAQQLK